MPKMGYANPTATPLVTIVTPFSNVIIDAFRETLSWVLVEPPDPTAHESARTVREQAHQESGSSMLLGE